MPPHAPPSRPLRRRLRAHRAWLLAGVLSACGHAPADLGAQTAPPSAVGPTRPQLSERQAQTYSLAAVLGATGKTGQRVADGWDPLADAVLVGDAVPALHYRVDPAAADGQRVFASVQAAVNRAHTDIRQGRQTAPRVYIGVAPGDYPELVYVPASATPITLWGLGAGPAQVRIHAALDATTPGPAYRARFAPVYEAADMHPDIAALYQACAQRATLGTTCSSVMVVRNDGFQLRRISVANSDTAPPAGSSGVHQAVAFKSDGADRVQLEQVHLLGRQDTLYLGSRPGAPGKARTFVHRSLVSGDIDFIFGAGTAFFLRSEIRWVGDQRGLVNGYVAAPSTPIDTPHGFVFEDCDFTHAPPPGAAGKQGTQGTQGTVALARQWFVGATCSPYGDQGTRCTIAPGNGPGGDGLLTQGALDAVGKMVVLRSRLGPHLHPSAPWAPWQSDRASRAYRPAQFDSEDFWRHLERAGLDPLALGYQRPQPAEPFLGEYHNLGPTAGPGKHQATFDSGQNRR